MDPFHLVIGEAWNELNSCQSIIRCCFGISTLAAIYHHFKDHNKIPVFAGLLILVFTGSFAAWSVAGLEQPLVVFLLTVIIIKSFSIIDDFEKSLTGFI